MKKPLGRSWDGTRDLKIVKAAFIVASGVFTPLPAASQRGCGKMYIVVAQWQ